MVQAVTPVLLTRLPGHEILPNIYKRSIVGLCPGNPDKVCLEIEKNGGEAFPLAASVEDTNAIMGAVKGKNKITNANAYYAPPTQNK